jgi:hypothetical protein
MNPSRPELVATITRSTPASALLISSTLDLCDWPERLRCRVTGVRSSRMGRASKRRHDGMVVGGRQADPHRHTGDDTENSQLEAECRSFHVYPSFSLACSAKACRSRGAVLQACFVTYAGTQQSLM